ncbi:MAG: ABC transporter substrate-binding protein [Aliarcobacter sp.]|nr:ABC transporter substrate-binding protein [Aliarcobacter sp.]
MFIKKLLFIYFIILLNLQANEKQKVTLYQDWLNQFQFAGYYMAKEKGFYDEVNLDVDIIEYKNNDITKDVMENEAAYGIGKSTLIVDKFDGNNVILLSSIFQNSALVLISLENSNIKTPKDLINKKIMITNDAKQSASIKSMIVSQGVKLEDITIQEHSFNIEDLINGKTDAMACYLSNEPYILNQKNIKFNILNPHDYNFDFYEGILFTSKKELENNPTRVQNFNQASLKGWKYAFDNIEETSKIIYEKYNTQNKSLDSLIYEGSVLRNLAKVNENLLGNINSQNIDEIKRFYTLLGLNNLNTLFETNTLLFNKNIITLDKNELEYLNNNQFTLLVENNKIPFSFKNVNELIGIEIDFWKLISNKLEKPFNIEETIKDGFLNIFSNSIKTKFIYSFKKNLSNEYLLSNSIAQIPIALATKNNVNYISELSSLNNVPIGVLKDLDLISSLKKDYPNINFIETTNIDDGIYKLKNHKIFALIDNLYAISHKIEEFKVDELKINTTLKYKIDMHLQVDRRNEQFIKILNNAISTLTDKEKIQILNNYQLILYHKNIDFIYVLKFIIPLIMLLAVFIFLNYRLKNEVKRRKEIEIKLSNFANNDSLTNIYNRRKIEELCENELKRSDRYNNDLSLIFFDVNDFKIINDKLGHHKGDEVLIKIANTISQNIRSSDYFGRWGGDEFLIVLPQTDIFKTKHIIETLENKLRDMDFDDNTKISCSFGSAQYEKNDTLDSLLKKADDSMYKIKKEYKNKALKI